MRKTKEEAEETRKAILRSALDTFYEKGYSKTTFDEIARRINLTKGAVYWYFRNKPDLIAALINDYFDRQKAVLQERLPEMKSFDDILKWFLYNAEFILSSEPYYKFVFFISCQMEWSEGIITKVLSQVEENKDTWYKRLKETLTFMQKNGEICEDVNVEHLVSIIMNMWTGILNAYMSKRCTVDLTVMIEESFNLIFNGLKKERTENASK